MPLDPANFISELSIDDPPGTDPLDQGDDQIRTTKRATQQSFPNVDAAVPQTAAQMAQMAIKNEVNTFTQSQIFQQLVTVLGSFRAADNSAATPSYGFTNNTNMGMFRAGADILGFAVFGNSRLHIINNGIRADFDGDANRPAWSFTSSVDMGMFRESANELGFSVSGIRRFRLSTNVAFFGTGVSIRPANNGSAAAPTYAFTDNFDLGMYRDGTDRLSFSVAGIRKLSLTTNTLITDPTVVQIRPEADGNAALPMYSFTNNSNMGMFRDGSNVLAFATAGVQRMNLTATAMQLQQPIHAPDGVGSAAPSYSFALDPTMGMFKSGAVLSFSVAGGARMGLNEFSQMVLFAAGATGSATQQFANSAGVRAWEWSSEGSGSPFQPLSFTLVRYNATTGAFLSNPMRIDPNGRVLMENLPASDPGIPGALFRTGNNVNVSL